VRLRVDPELCVGHGRCYMLAPEVYSEDERGHCRVRPGELRADLEPAARLGADNCPEGAILIEDD
jgi:ferredoxin